MSLIKKYYELPYEERDYYLNNLEFDDDMEKWSLYLNVLNYPDNQDPNYDLLAIRVLSILEIAEIPKMFLSDFIESYINILQNSEDDDIKNYVVIASERLMNNNIELKNEIIKILKNPNESIIIRKNAYFAVLALISIFEKKEILNYLLLDKELKDYAKRDLESL